jgi:hypothetical protein
MAEIFTENIKLENGLVLELFDGSKKVAGDRWYVALIARIRIPVSAEWFSDKRFLINIDNARDLLGAEVIFEQKREAHFLDEKEKENILKGMADAVLSGSLSYFSHPHFPAKYILKLFDARLNKGLRQ